MRWLLLTLLVLSGARCTHVPAPRGTATAPANWPEPQPPALRLPDTVRPVRYTLDLTLLPAEPTFSGTVTIDLDVREPTRQVWLHAQDLTLAQARVRTGERVLEARTVDGGEGRLGVLLPEPLAAGAAQLTLAFRGHPDRLRSQGIYVVEEGGEPALYTFFEPTDARRAFPCFDEPGFKVPWRLRFTVKQEHVAVANHALLSEEPLPGGLKRVTFADSRPMPSYLVAFMVGPFDVVDAGRVGRPQVPLRFVVPRGRGAETAYAVRATPRLITLLEDFFDDPYPYEKLDVAVVPRYWGTMEHPGIVALGQPLTLIRPSEETTQRRQHYVNIAIHELAHYWFSAMVTCRWWDDTWLNESLTSWVDRQVTEQFDPAWRYREKTQFRFTAFALDADALTTTLPVRKPIRTAEDLTKAFDNSTTYSKGAALLDQWAGWLGETRVRDALRSFAREHAWGSVTSEDFLASMGQHLGPDAADVLRGFVEQSGVPRVSAELQCTPGQTPRLKLAQERYLRAGSEAPPQTWRIPVCVRAEGRESRVCTLLTGAGGELELPGKPCPGWVLLNAGGSGYYRSGYTLAQAERLGALPPGVLTTRERLALLGDVRAGVDRGDLRLGDAWRLVSATARDKDWLVLQQGALLASLPAERLPEEMRPHYRAWLRELYGAPARALGWKPRPDEGEDVKALRQTLLWSAVIQGEDPALRAEAETLARAWLADRAALSAETSWLALRVAARSGDRALFDTLIAQARAAKEPEERRRLLSMLGQFQDPVLLREALALVVSDTFDARDTVDILSTALSHRAARDQAWTFFQEHFEQLADQMRTDEANRLLEELEAFCDDAWLTEAEAWLTPRVARIEGGALTMKRVLESVRLCAESHRHQVPSVVTFLKARR